MTYETLIICLLIAFISVTFWNIYSLNTIRKLSRNHASNIQDAKYYELKFNIQFLIAFFTVIVTIFSALGYNSLTNAKEEVKNNLNDAMDSIRTRLDRIQPELVRAENIISDYKKLNDDLQKLQNNIKQINSKNILKQSYYVVPSVKYKLDDPKKDEFKLIEFRNLRTHSGDRLPTFNSPPMIIPVPAVTIYDITTTSFKVSVYGGQLMSEENILSGTTEFSLLVLEK
jgi:hypothetical protein